MKINRLLEDVIDNTSKDIAKLFNEVMLKTPKKTGAARSSHSLKSKPFNKKQTSYKIYKAKQLKQNLESDTLELVSNCPYIGKLESGASNQAPFGFYGIALLNFKNNTQVGT